MRTSGKGDAQRPSDATKADDFALKAPAIGLPKGGGAIRGIGEKFTANPVTGTGSMSVPIYTSPGRGGFGPQLALAYDSGAGNGPFGLGWNLSLPAISRKTDKGLPRYRDGDAPDVFLLSGSEDLVPEFKKDATTGAWIRDPAGNLVRDEAPRDGYLVQRYRPRIEGLFARIERWTSQTDRKDTFWRSISRDNVTTFYGKTDASRICDPADPTRIFSWLLCESYDDKGNVIVYSYKAEDQTRVDLTQPSERNRTIGANRHLKRILYGNRVSHLVDPDLGEAEWLFEVVFDYAEHSTDDPKPDDDDTGDWLCRHDPFSSYRAGFEVRTHRLCQRVLMFHHFEDETIGRNCLVRSTDFVYRDIRDNPDDRTKGHPRGAFIASVTQTGYKRQSAGDGYRKKSLPPLELGYTEAKIEESIHDVDAGSLENLPIGLDGAGYQWVDLDGEGISGIFTEQADAWFYKRNLGPISTVTDADGVVRSVAAFAPLERVATKPAFAATGAGGWQLQDLAGDGRPDLARFDGPTPGFFERTDEAQWDNFVPFRSLPNVNWRDPNLRFVDVTGDGLADLLITGDDGFTWYRSLGETGFAPSERTRPSLDEEAGPRLVFADGQQSIYLADLSGDGLTDLMRIRNGEVCYWPNLGYGRFGAKVTMDNAPWFDAPDQFAQQRIRLADVDGSGVVDIIYLGRHDITVYFNQSGNSWSAGTTIDQLPQVDDLTAVQVVDLFGNGTACLVWSSPLPGDARRPMRYIDLMGGQKPNLLVKMVNNLGVETRVQYAASTKFYLADKAAGRPWITRLPFPVHVVEKVTVTDKWRHTSFSSTSSYHHGYFDGTEREFRGFGRVEQVDVESFGKFAAGNADSPYITLDTTLYQPPVKTVTWFHTGAMLDRERILTQFQTEYFPSSLATLSPPVADDAEFAEKALPEPDLASEDLSTDEWREALRACKGMTLRQEVYELSVDELEKTGKHVPVRLFSAATHNCSIQRLQPQADNPHAVFLVTESEALSYHYELELRPSPAGSLLKPDPRVAHTLNLSFDELGNVQQSIAVGYPRWRAHVDPTLIGERLDLIHEVQQELHLAYSETHYTEDAPRLDDHRTPQPYEVETYELTRVVPAGRYFQLAELQRLALSTTYPPIPATGPSVVLVGRLAYHEQPPNAAPPTTPAKPYLRQVEHARTLFLKDDLSGPLGLGQLGTRGLLYEQYKLALTEDLLDAVFTAGQLEKDVPAAHRAAVVTVRGALKSWQVSGYLNGADAILKFGPLAAGQYWMRSGVAGFAADAADHFYLPEKFTDAFDNSTLLAYDGKYDLFVQSSTDARGNTTRVTAFDYRGLAPLELEDINANRTAAWLDVLGRVIAVAVKGKVSAAGVTQADNLDDYDDDLANPELSELLTYFDLPPLTAEEARDRFSPMLGNATSRYLYHFGEARDAAGRTVWGDRPAGACAIVREQHVADVEKLRLTDPDAASPLQVSFECSDGSGTVLMKRSQAEPDPATTTGLLRWIVSGKTVLNNKGKPVKQYEPYFSAKAGCCAEGDVHEEVGVTPLMYYDAAGRLVRTELPDGTLSRVERSPWHVLSFDANDTVLESRWYADRKPPEPPVTPKQRAAWLAAQHANTPAVTIVDSLGRDVIGVAHNKYTDFTGILRDEKYLTFTKLDAEGKPRWICDVRGNLVMQYISPPRPNHTAFYDLPNPSYRAAYDVPPTAVPCYDIAGNLLYQHSMDAGDRWMLNDAAGKLMFAWDVNQRQDDTNAFVDEDRLYTTRYDSLHRPIEQWLAINDDLPEMVERFEYVDAGWLSPPQILADVQARNLCGQLDKHYDPSGLVRFERIDFNGSPLEVQRQLVADYEASVTDWQGSPAARLESETFQQITEYDALKRMTRQYNWHRLTTPDKRVAVYEPRYNERGLLVAEQLVVRATRNAATSGRRYDEGVGSKRADAIRSIVYDAKGQKQSLRLGNGAHPGSGWLPDERDAARVGSSGGLGDVRSGRARHRSVPSAAWT